MPKRLWPTCGHAPMKRSLSMCLSATARRIAIKELRSKQPLSLSLGIGHTAPMTEGASGHACWRFLVTMRSTPRYAGWPMHAQSRSAPRRFGEDRRARLQHHHRPAHHGRDRDRSADIRSQRQRRCFSLLVRAGSTADRGFARPLRFACRQRGGQDFDPDGPSGFNLDTRWMPPKIDAKLHKRSEIG